MKRPWDDTEEAFLRECALASIPTDQIARMLDRSLPAVRTRRSLRKLLPPCGVQIHMTVPQVKISVSEIKRTVAAHFHIDVENMTNNSRARSVARPRQVAMFFAREVANRSYPSIGAMFGGRDHTTVLHAVRQVGRLMNEDQQFKDTVTTIEREIVSKERHSNLAGSPYSVDKSLESSFAAETAGA